MRASRLLPAAAVSLTLALGAATPAHAGPPWISIELPANPMDATTRGAYLLVHTFHHQQLMESPLVGRAEGVVNGRRQTITLAFTETSRSTVRALRKNWPDGGTWVLVISTGDHGDATALVGIGADGTVRSIEVPTQTRDNHTGPRKVTQADVDAMLTRLASADTPVNGPTRPALALGALLVFPAGLLLLRRRG
ncbi:MAG TPA: hypothetical protein VFV65_07125 [Gemmatimonadales bacterium]|nr:hypothetical protein [Gemmatimonadales bacterium]